MTDDLFDIETRVHEATAQLVLAGECDMAGAARLRQAVDALQDQGVRHLILDLRRLDFLDSSGIHALMDLDANARSNGHNVTVVRPPERITQTFRTLGLDDYFVLVDDPGALAPPPEPTA